MYRVEPLSSSHDRSQFFSGSPALDRYFREMSMQESKRALASCFVAVSIAGGEVAAFYTLTATSVTLRDLPPAVSRILPRYPIVPAARLGCLAVTESHQKAGLGGVLVAHAVLGSARAEWGVFALLAEALDETGLRFYQHFGFTLLPGDTRRLCLPFATALRRV